MSRDDVHIEGTFSTDFENVAQILSDNLASGADVGASVCIIQDGKNVVDIWGGYVDEESRTPWARNTIVNVWSITKTMTALCALLLYDRGELDMNAPVAKYWPEFAVNGKENIEVRHLLSHTSGIAGWDQVVTLEDICDTEMSTALLAAQAPWWTPGTASGYHLLTYGHLIGEVVKRVSGQTLGNFFANEIASPLQADFHIGLDPSDLDRVSDVITPVPPPGGSKLLDMLPNDNITKRTFKNLSPSPFDPMANTELWRRSEVGAANGHGNAQSVAKIQSIVSHHGEVGGKQFISERTIEKIFEEQSNGPDQVLFGMQLRFGIGYGIGDQEWLGHGFGSHRACWWSGMGGSRVVNFVDDNLTISYVMNKMAPAAITGEPRGNAIVSAAFKGAFS